MCKYTCAVSLFKWPTPGVRGQTVSGRSSSFRCPGIGWPWERGRGWSHWDSPRVGTWRGHSWRGYKERSRIRGHHEQRGKARVKTQRTQGGHILDILTCGRPGVRVHSRGRVGPQVWDYCCWCSSPGVYCCCCSSPGVCTRGRGGGGSSPWVGRAPWPSGRCRSQSRRWRGSSGACCRGPPWIYGTQLHQRRLRERHVSKNVLILKWVRENAKEWEGSLFVQRGQTLSLASGSIVASVAKWQGRNSRGSETSSHTLLC